MSSAGKIKMISRVTTPSSACCLSLSSICLMRWYLSRYDCDSDVDTTLLELPLLPLIIRCLCFLRLLLRLDLLMLRLSAAAAGVRGERPCPSNSKDDAW